MACPVLRWHGAVVANYARAGYGKRPLYACSTVPVVQSTLLVLPPACRTERVLHNTHVPY
eukprot:2484742-Rhodomonas_salina.2